MVQEIIKKALSYDDVLLMPRYSTIVSRKDVDTSSQLTGKLKLEIPIVSSNMDTVTESNMAIAMARMGGIGIIHRYMTTDDQVKEVLKVKRAEAIFIERPYTLNVDLKLQDAIELMDQKKITGIPIVDEVGRFVGILTNRDLMFENNLNKPIKDLMTPKGKAITAPYGIDIETAKTILKEHKVEKLPLIDNNGILKGLVTLKDIRNKEKYPNASKDSKGRLLVGGAIGVRGDYLERAEALIEANCDVLVIDIAHGHHENMLKTIRALRDKFGNIQLIAGNVATARGTEELIKAGADAIKVGVGGGSICVTRIVTGFGVPQLSAILDSARVAKDYGIPIIADGGIKQAGDITKALAAGASTVMLGNLLAGTDESPGQTIIKEGRKFKVYRGMAGFGANMSKRERDGVEKDLSDVVPEGVEGKVPYRGSVNEVVYQLIGGYRSGLSYAGAKNINELWNNAEFVEITQAGLRESHSHDIDKM